MTWAALGLRERSQVQESGVGLNADLGPIASDAWAGELDQIIVPGGFGVTEVAFLHRASRTLILTDLIENFEPEKIGGLYGWLVPLAGAAALMGRLL